MIFKGLLVVDKPSGMTSHDVVARLRRATRERRIGHTGTLDPAATGVLVICFGQATRLIPFLDESDKHYLTHLILGVATDTQDFTGQALQRCEETHITREALTHTLETFTGEIQQIPPMYSAIKREGRPLYELARLGQEVERAPRPVTIFALDPAQPLTEVYRIGEGPWLRVHCSKGTYIRTLCHDIGTALNCGGHMGELRREASGHFTLANSIPLDEAIALADRGELASRLLSPAHAVAHLESILLNEDQMKAVRQGKTLFPGKSGVEGNLAAGLYDDELIAILKAGPSGEWRPIRVFN